VSIKSELFACNTVKNNSVKNGKLLAAVVASIIQCVTVFVLEHRSVKLKFYTVADNTVFS